MVSLWKLFAVSLILAVVEVKATPTQNGVSFEKGKLVLNGKVITVELAKTAAQHEQGLMYRRSLPQDQGMLFIFEDEDIRYFWMKNTYIDLSIGYFNRRRILVDVQEMKAMSVIDTRPPTYPSAKPAMYALEMTKGWFKKNKVKIGDSFQFSSR